MGQDAQLLHRCALPCYRDRSAMSSSLSPRASTTDSGGGLVALELCGRSAIRALSCKLLQVVGELSCGGVHCRVLVNKANRFAENY